jgi:phosphoribosylamine-glycine ligase
MARLRCRLPRRRLGDPEAQVLIMRLMSDLLPALIAARERVLKSVDLRWHAEHALCVVMATRGYSGEPQPGTEISDLTVALEGCLVFYGDLCRTGLKRRSRRGGEPRVRARASNGVDKAVKRPEPEIRNPATPGRNEVLHVR